MTMRNALRALIAELEAATGPDRTLDASIAVTLAGFHKDFIRVYTESNLYKKEDIIPRFTDALDPANLLRLKLIPQHGLIWVTGVDDNGAPINGAIIVERGNPDKTIARCENAANMAIALVIAVARVLEKDSQH